MLDEMAHAGPEHLDGEFIAGFDRKQGYPDPEADIAAFEVHGLDGMSTVVDFDFDFDFDFDTGTGTGTGTLYEGKRQARVPARPSREARASRGSLIGSRGDVLRQVAGSEVPGISSVPS